LKLPQRRFETQRVHHFIHPYEKSSINFYGDGMRYRSRQRTKLKAMHSVCWQNRTDQWNPLHLSFCYLPTLAWILTLLTTIVRLLKWIRRSGLSEFHSIIKLHYRCHRSWHIFYADDNQKCFWTTLMKNCLIWTRNWEVL
jgi:hypothetical protein